MYIHIYLSDAESAFSNRLPHLAIPIDFTHNSLRRHSSKSSPQSPQTSLHAPYNLTSLRVCFCLNSRVGAQPVCFVS